MTVTELRDRLPASELADWLELGRVQPWGREREDMRAAIGLSAVVKALAGKGAKNLRWKDFVPPTWGDESASSVSGRGRGGTRWSPHQMVEFFKAKTRQMGGKVIGD